MPLVSYIRAKTSADKKLYKSLRNILGFYPKNLSLYQQAFRHSSVAKEIKNGVKDSNERLEYLGDAVISAAVAEYLFKTFPYKDEGFLTKMRSKMVSRSQLNQLALKLGINHFIEKTGESSNSSINGDAFEALIGAIYLDKGYKRANDFLLNRVIRNHVDINEVELRETDYKSKLIEWVQKEKKALNFHLLEEVGVGNSKQYHMQAIINEVVYGKGLHFSKKKAEQMAAEQTCTSLGI